MTVAQKLQIRSGQSVAVLREPADVDLALEPAASVDDPASADAVLLFVARAENLQGPEMDAFAAAVRRDALAWVAYPKARQRGTDLNRDSLAAKVLERGLRAVRQVSIDDTWSALRFRPAR